MVISLLLDAVRDKITSDARKAEFFSVSADTTPDVAHQDHISNFIRFVDSGGAPCEWLLEAKELSDKMIAFQSYDYAARCLVPIKERRQNFLKKLIVIYHIFHVKLTETIR